MCTGPGIWTLEERTGLVGCFMAERLPRQVSPPAGSCSEHIQSGTRVCRFCGVVHRPSSRMVPTSTTVCGTQDGSLVPLLSRMPEAQQRVGGCFLNLMPQMKTLYLAYCANHPSAVSVLTEHRCVSGTCLPERGVAPWGPPGAARFCQILRAVQCEHSRIYSKMIILITLGISA